MSDNPKVSFAQAAKMLGVHVNTLKNWQRAGRLSSAEKAKVKGVWTWIVDYSEAAQVNQQGYTIIDSTAQYNQHQTEAATEPPEAANNQQGLMVLPQEAYTGLLALVEKQGDTIAKMAEEIGGLKERVKQLENQPAPPAPAVAPDQPPPTKKRWPWQR